jgi:hypothetical protein
VAAFLPPSHDHRECWVHALSASRRLRQISPEDKYSHGHVLVLRIFVVLHMVEQFDQHSDRG